MAVLDARASALDAQVDELVDHQGELDASDRAGMMAGTTMGLPQECPMLCRKREALSCETEPGKCSPGSVPN